MYIYIHIYMYIYIYPVGSRTSTMFPCSCTPPCLAPALPEREFFIDNLLFRVQFIILMIRWTCLAPWEFEFPFPGSLPSTFLGCWNVYGVGFKFGSNCFGCRIAFLRSNAHGVGCRVNFPGSLTSTFLVHPSLLPRNPEPRK